MSQQPKKRKLNDVSDTVRERLRLTREQFQKDKESGQFEAYRGKWLVYHEGRFIMPLDKAEDIYLHPEYQWKGVVIMPFDVKDRRKKYAYKLRAL